MRRPGMVVVVGYGPMDLYGHHGPEPPGPLSAVLGNPEGYLSMVGTRDGLPTLPVYMTGFLVRVGGVETFR